MARFACALLQIMVSVSERRMRPDIPAKAAELPGGVFDGWAAYTALLQRCWAHEPAERPTFDVVIAELRELLSESASSVRARRMSEPPASAQQLPGGGAAAAAQLAERSAPAAAGDCASPPWLLPFFVSSAWFLCCRLCTEHGVDSGSAHAWGSMQEGMAAFCIMHA
jgi:hypothetical protein